MTTSPAGARDQVARLLTLVPFLHSRGKVRLEDAAEALGVPPEQVLADLKVLLMCGLPGGYPDDLIDVDLDALEEPEGDGVIRVTNADYLARPLRLTPTEATAIIVALRALRGSADGDTREVVDRALAKLEAAAAHGAEAPAIDPGEAPGGPDLVRLEADLARAAADARQVRLHYFVPSRDEQSERVVDPRGIVRAHGFAYLDAWCHSAEAPRLFRLDRIQRAEVLDTPIQTEPAPPRDLGPEGLFERSADTTVVTLALEPAARWIVEYYPTDDVRPRRGGRLEVDLVVADERWLQRLLLRLAPHARVLAPSDIQERYLQAAGDTLRLYD
ncbi:WYL domain-containing protein [Nocardioides sp. MAH-18]|uniref:WYL domain-containing protein n=1 Tax=Nocardioides agri TaxID=2682843 RepID=A0A6L6XXT5_9ACTN|nr:MULTISPECIES: WYL domain-containing protein [unclassified Nocardioides]MBA2952746.1 WYL domain-containing protein [Nocardioides sp. CGMCC 1.13656]MVQ51908.1 WYL domain-containing protein [Nocardioides sp. MAH-18]